MGRPLSRTEAGFTLVEVMVAAFLLLVGVLGTFSLVDVANDRTILTAQREQAVNLARDLAERAASADYAALTAAGAQAALGGPPSGAWTIDARGTDYGVTVTACKVDEPIDGQGERTSGGFCPDSGPGATADRDPDDLRRVGITIRWTGRDGRARSHTQTALVNQPGSARAPQVLSIAPTAPVPADPTSITFAVTTTPAERIRWFVDGEAREVITTPATADRRTWSFTWADTSAAKVPDATYVVSVRAYDAAGRFRNERLFRVTINRRRPAPPQAAKGGHTLRLTGTALASSAEAGASVVDLVWTTSTDPDVIGYRVYRDAGGTWAYVCSTGLDDEADPLLASGVPYRDELLTCADPAPPSAHPIRYAVVPVDVDPATGEPRVDLSAGGYRAVDVALPPAGAARPPAPVVSGTRTQGRVELRWTYPTGSGVEDFRIYRADGDAPGEPLYAQRYHRTGTGVLSTAATISWIDDAAGTQARTYHVCSVNTALAESASCTRVVV